MTYIKQHANACKKYIVRENGVMGIEELVTAGAAYGIDRVQMRYLPDCLKNSIHSAAEFSGSVWLSKGACIGESYIGARSTFEYAAEIGHGVFIDEGVTVESGAKIYRDAFIGARAIIGCDATLYDRVIIGSDTQIPPEAQVGVDSIIPDSKSIVCLGRFGTSQRVVTIHGSESGPKYSIGCQDSVEWQHIRYRILNSTETEQESADHYVAYLDVFNAVGKQVQLHYDKQAPKIAELKDEIRSRRIAVWL